MFADPRPHGDSEQVVSIKLTEEQILLQKSVPLLLRDAAEGSGRFSHSWKTFEFTADGKIAESFTQQMLLTNFPPASGGSN